MFLAPKILRILEREVLKITCLTVFVMARYDVIMINALLILKSLVLKASFLQIYGLKV